MSGMPRAFTKVEGLGNDFVLLEADHEDAITANLAKEMCDRRYGIGADGVLMVLPPRAGGDARMHVINADGSVPEMCGNGLRCVVHHVATRGGLNQGELAIETDAGVRKCTFECKGESALVEVEMGDVRIVGTRTLSPRGIPYELTLVDAGNPHAVAYRDDPAGELESVGLLLATDPSFERGTNVELVRWARGVLELAVWERGAGRTLACGTGACAAVAVACARGEAASGKRVIVRLPGGDLTITHDVEAGATRMLGLARRVFDGAWPGLANR
jgi:diaminopimelate epimerase